MQYTLVHHAPGRMRFRCGKWMFNQEEQAGLIEYLQNINGVSSVVIRPANGSILVEHEGNSAHEVLKALDSLDVFNLPQSTDLSQVQASSVDNSFQSSLAKTISLRYFMKLFVPTPIRNVVTILRSIKFVFAALKALSRMRLTVDVLDATAILVSLARRDFKTASSVMFMLRISDILAEYTEQHVRYALRNNLAVLAQSAWLINEDGIELEVPLEEVELGDVIRVRTGSVIPLDGVVVEGLADVNEASMTGESALAHKHQGSTVHAGTVVEDGSVLIRTSSRVGQSRIDQIVDMVEHSQDRKAQAQSRAETLADSIVPLSLSLFVATLVLTRNITKAVSVLMVDYSCAIKLSAPVAVMTAMKEATDNYFVAKGGKYLEALAQSNAIVFDKTGTLTKASPSVEAILSFSSLDEDEILRLAACLEEHFPHSVARAIVNAAREKSLCHKDEEHSEVEYIVAHGIASKVNNKRILLGSAHFVFDDENIEKPEGIEDQIAKTAPAASSVYMAIDGELVGAICVNDPLRPEAYELVQSLRAYGFEKIVMLTGDSENAARLVASTLDLDDYKAQVLPEDKSNYIKELKAQGYIVAMVGDGINDSPALAEADVSIALDDASDIARNVADISIKGDSLDTIIIAKELSEKLFKRINHSYSFIISFNSLLILLGILGLIQPTVSAGLHNGSTVLLGFSNSRKYLS